MRSQEDHKKVKSAFRPPVAYGRLCPVMPGYARLKKCDAIWRFETVFKLPFASFRIFSGLFFPFDPLWNLELGALACACYELNPL